MARRLAGGLGQEQLAVLLLPVVTEILRLAQQLRALVEEAFEAFGLAGR